MQAKFGFTEERNLWIATFDSARSVG